MSRFSNLIPSPASLTSDAVENTKITLLKHANPSSRLQNQAIIASKKGCGNNEGVENDFASFRLKTILVAEKMVKGEEEGEKRGNIISSNFL